MSPLSQLAFHRGYNGGIDHDFSPILRYIDELDRHFSHHHSFMNCFIPRFDLEEDDRFYYLCGEIPGAKADDIVIEPHDDHTLIIYGATHRPSTGPLGPKQNQIDGEHPLPPPTRVSGTKLTEEAEFDPSDPTDKPAFTSRHIRLPFHHSTADATTQAGNTPKASQQLGQGILLSERLVGNFHRTFAFPMPVIEEAIKANLEDGLLSLLIPKKVKCKDMDKVRRIPIVGGN